MKTLDRHKLFNKMLTINIQKNVKNYYISFNFSMKGFKNVYATFNLNNTRLYLSILLSYRR